MREPLVHFLLAALLVFALHAVWQARTDKREATIYISKSDQERMAALFTSEAGSLPTETDMYGMLADQVRDEALAREARRLGLDENDTIITRRLSQKMSFMVSDLNAETAPSEAEIQDWYAAHPGTFTEPETFTFVHVFLSPEQRGQAIRDDADTLLSELIDNPQADWTGLGDPFMLQRSYGALPAREIARLFGGEFADALTGLTPSAAWHGPVASAYGLHLVQLKARTPETLIPLETARPAVIEDWQETRRREQNERAIADIVARYTVEIEGAR